MAMNMLKDIPWSQDTILQVLSELEQVKLRRNLSDDARKCLARGTTQSLFPDHPLNMKIAATEDLAKALLYNIH
jgi:hypothetical protein